MNRTYKTDAVNKWYTSSLIYCDSSLSSVHADIKCLYANICHTFHQIILHNFIKLRIFNFKIINQNSTNYLVKFKSRYLNEVLVDIFTLFNHWSRMMRTNILLIYFKYSFLNYSTRMLNSFFLLG